MREVTELLATAIFLVGFGCGTINSDPLSAVHGFSPVYIGSLVLIMLFLKAASLAPKFNAQIALRFLAEFFGSPPLTCAGSTVSHLWNSLQETWAFPLFRNSRLRQATLDLVIGS